MKYAEVKKIKADILEIGKRMYERKFVAANDGNISCRAADHTIWITPTGISKGYMEADTFLNVSLEGNVLKGKGKPSSEMAMHLAVYKENPKINAVIHAHPPVATAYAIAGMEIDTSLYPEVIALLGSIPIAPFATPGTIQVGETVKKFCKEHTCVLLANHGAVTWGETLMQSWYRMESLEQYANILTITRQILQKESPLSKEQMINILC